MVFGCATDEQFLYELGGFMPNSKNKKHVNLSADLVQRFDYVFPNVKALFIERALTLALQDKKYFEDVFFNPIFIEVK